MTIDRDSLLTLEAYAKVRTTLRERLILHKKSRTAHLGDHLTLLFEDEHTVRYQIQEMLRIEKIFDEPGIRAELDAYTPLIPDGSNFKATVFIEYGNETERRAALARLIGIEDRLFVQVKGEAPVYAISDEDLERDNAEKTSAIHFARFELTRAMKSALRKGVSLKIGCDHPNYRAELDPLPEPVRASLVADLT